LHYRGAFYKAVITESADAVKSGDTTLASRHEVLQRATDRVKENFVPHMTPVSFVNQSEEKAQIFYSKVNAFLNGFVESETVKKSLAHKLIQSQRKTTVSLG